MRMPFLVDSVTWESSGIACSLDFALPHVCGPTCPSTPTPCLACQARVCAIGVRAELTVGELCTKALAVVPSDQTMSCQNRTRSLPV